MGGAAGHMMHVYEDTNLTFSELKKILSDLTTGQTDLYEKIDGQNLFVTFDADQSNLFAARNLSDIRRGGVSPQEFLSRWAGHPAEKAFTGGFRALLSLFNKISAQKLKNIFNNDGEKYFLNLEIVCASHPNVLQYGKNCIVFHELLPRSSNSDKRFDSLVELVDGSQVLSEDETWEMSGPRKIIVDSFQKEDSLASAHQRLDSLGMRDDATLGDFIAEKLRTGIVGELPVSTVKQEQIIKSVLADSNAPPVSSLKSGESTEVQKIISSLCTQENSRKARLKFLEPIEAVINEFAFALLGDMKSAFAGSHESVVAKLQADVNDAVSKIKALSRRGDSRADNLLTQQLPKIKTIQSLNSSVEGIVFRHPCSDVTYKITGLFSPANQLVGFAKRN